MNIYVISLLLLFSSCRINSNETKNLNLKKYYEYTSKAEVFIVCGKFLEASQMYEKAFEYKDEPFLADLYNSMYSNHLIKKTTDIFNNLKNIVRISGLSMKCIKNSYSYLTKYEKEFQDFEVWHPQGLKYNKSIQRRDLINLVTEIDASDQRYRGGEDRYTTYKTKNDSIDSINFFKILNLLRNHGYPKESEIGVYEKLEFTGFESRLETALIHCFQSTEKSWYSRKLVNEMDSLLELAVKNGNLHSEELFTYRYHKHLYERDYEKLKYHELPFQVINNNAYVLPIAFQQTDSINIEFDKMFLDPVEIQYFKAKYILDNLPIKFFKISERGCCLFMNFQNPSEAIEMVKIIGLKSYNQFKEIFPDDYCK